MQDPPDETAEANALWRYSELHHLADTRMNLKSLVATQQAGDAKGNSSAHSVYIKDNFTSNVIQEVYPSKSCHGRGIPLEKSTKELAKTN